MGEADTADTTDTEERAAAPSPSAMPGGEETQGTTGGRGAIRKLAVLGAGKMGGAIVTRVVQSGLVPPGRVVVSEPDAGARAALKARLGVQTMFDHHTAVQGASAILLATVPQVVPAVMVSLRDSLQSDQVVLSIAAGVELGTLIEGLHHPAIIRVMPNTLAEVGQSISVWMATDAVTAEQKAQAQAILRTFGREFEVDRERYLDMATAVSGSGPAWVMLMLEAMTDAGVQIGLQREWAYDLALQTMSGSVELARHTGKHPAELRNMVTSPAGTTAAGLYAMEQGGLRAAIVAGIAAAYQRCLALGAEASRTAQ